MPAHFPDRRKVVIRPLLLGILQNSREIAFQVAGGGGRQGGSYPGRQRRAQRGGTVLYDSSGYSGQFGGGMGRDEGLIGTKALKMLSQETGGGMFDEL